MTNSGTSNNEMTFPIFMSAPFKIGKSGLLFLGWRVKGSFVFFEVAKERQEWYDFVGFNFPFYAVSRCSKVFGNLESSCKKFTFYYHIIEIIFSLHET